MAEQIIETPSDERSPCLNCKYEKEDKSECMDFCKRLSAFQQGHSYANIAHFEKVAQISPKEPETPKTGKPTAKKPDWEKAMPKKTVWISAIKCEHCGKPASKKNKIQRGLCKKTCYAKWRRGTIELKSGKKWTPKFPLFGGKKKLDKMKTKAMHKITQPEIIEDIVTIDFTDYPELYQVILKISKLQYLPINHAVINLIAAGIMWGEKKIAAEKGIR